MLNNSESQLDFASLHLVLYVETEQNYVSVFYHIVLAFQTNQTFLTSCGIGAGIQQILVVHNFGANEATFEITVNLTSWPAALSFPYGLSMRGSPARLRSGS